MEIMWKHFKNVKIATFEASEEEEECETMQKLTAKKEKKRNYWSGERKFVKAGFVIFHIKLVVQETLWEMKRNQSFFRSLKNKEIFIDRQYLDTVDIVKVGGLLYSHCKYTNIIGAINELNERINENFGADVVYLQLVPHSLFVGNGRSKIQTRLLAVECCSSDGDEVKRRLRECL